MFSSAFLREQHERRAVVARRAPRSTVRAASLRALPVIAVAHARRLIEQDDDLARAAGGRRGDRALRKNGRANAATISAIAAARISSSDQWRMRRRRTD